MLRFSITDSGVGIAQENLERIFGVYAGPADSSLPPAESLVSSAQVSGWGW